MAQIQSLFEEYALNLGVGDIVSGTFGAEAQGLTGLARGPLSGYKPKLYSSTVTQSDGLFLRRFAQFKAYLRKNKSNLLQEDLEN